ncbi:MAG: GH3 auxin-responsive promoter family protein, partial [Myxococcota bacterium]|nr:GH3 auxin-responsive promoter family protein [Myxococcota bacterium]
MERYLAGLEVPREIQQNRFDTILRGAHDTEFARDHGLDRVRTLDDFRSAVPIRSYEEHRPWLERIWNGESRVLTREPVIHLLETSGTTGEPKWLPVTRSWARSVADAQALWILGIVEEHEAVARGSALTMVSPAEKERSPGGIPVGSNTGRMHGSQPWWVRLRYPVPYEVVCLCPHDLQLYTVLRFALQAPIRSITTANPSTILLLQRRLSEWREALQEDLKAGTLRHGPAAALDGRTRRRLERKLKKLPPSQEWSLVKLWDLAVVNCWTSGPAAYFAERLRDDLGGVAVREVGITASEGYFAIPAQSGSGCVAWTHGHLLEFVGGDGRPRWAWELETGEQVRMVVTTEAGLYRYDLEDVVEVDGWCGRTPVLRFVGKAGRFLNSTGERVHANQVV